jgi:two-component system response regulator YesN
VIFQALLVEDRLPEPEHLVNLYHELSFFMLRTLMELIPYPQLASLQTEMHEYKPTTIKGYQESLQQLCSKGCKLISLLRRSEASELIEKSMVYIKRNLHLDLSVNHCAAQVHLSGSYYSNLFKKTTGFSVNQYITNERVLKAQDMLIQGHQVQEIATALGYGERRSFSDVFKKHTGLTPSEFKESMDNKQLEGGSS